MRRRAPALAAVLVSLALAGPAFAEDGVLTLRGRISPDMQYRLRIDYVTSVNDHACQFSDFITGMWDPNVESRYERPAVTGDRHSLSVPLAHPGGEGACGWRPSVVFVCVGPRGAADESDACRPLFLLARDASPPPPSVSLTCDPASWICVDENGRDPARPAAGFTQPIRLDLAARPLPPTPTP